MAVTISGKYELLGQLDKGGMGVVYKVRHLTLETVLALKALPAELAEDPEVVSGAVLYSDSRSSSQTTEGTNYLLPGEVSYRALLDDALQSLAAAASRKLETVVSTGRQARAKIAVAIDFDPHEGCNARKEKLFAALSFEEKTNNT